MPFALSAVMSLINNVLLIWVWYGLHYQEQGQKSQMGCSMLKDSRFKTHMTSFGLKVKWHVANAAITAQILQD